MQSKRKGGDPALLREVKRIIADEAEYCSPETKARLIEEFCPEDATPAQRKKFGQKVMQKFEYVRYRNAKAATVSSSSK